MIFKRQKYVDELVAGQGNGLVKIVTGGRRCGKSFLLFNLFHSYLLSHGVSVDHIIELSLDDRKSKRLRNPDALLDYIEERVKKDGINTLLISGRCPRDAGGDFIFHSCARHNLTKTLNLS